MCMCIYIYTCIYVYYLFTYVYVLIHIYIYILFSCVYIYIYIQTYLQYCIQTLYMSDSIGIIRYTLVLFQTLYRLPSSSPIATSVQEVSTSTSGSVRCTVSAGRFKGAHRDWSGSGGHSRSATGRDGPGGDRGEPTWGLKNHETKRKKDGFQLI